MMLLLPPSKAIDIDYTRVSMLFFVCFQRRLFLASMSCCPIRLDPAVVNAKVTRSQASDLTILSYRKFIDINSSTRQQSLLLGAA